MFGMLQGKNQSHVHKTAVKVPIRALSVSHAQQIGKHLLALSKEDRYLRFGYSESPRVSWRPVGLSQTDITA